MKPEPLKNKGGEVFEKDGRLTMRICKCRSWFRGKDIASAVAWLKKQLKRECKESNCVSHKFKYCEQGCELGLALKKINEAFPDITPISSGNKEGEK